MILRKLNKECTLILENDNKKREKKRQKSREIKSRIARNIKRRNTRILNRIHPNGHQYAADLRVEAEKEKLLAKKGQTLKKSPKSTKISVRKDPYRYTALITLPSISNINSNNCFINAVLQLLKKTHPIVQVMTKLNKKTE